MAQWQYGGECEIRTHGTLRYTRFPSVRLKPLGQLSGELREFLRLIDFTIMNYPSKDPLPIHRRQDLAPPASVQDRLR
jgi:hypothetical protein